MSKLTVLSPREINNTNFVSSTVPENDYPVWVAGTYAKGQRVIVLSTHSIYESVVDGNTDNPLAPAAEPKWLNIGPTNRWRVFDKSISSQTTNPGGMSYRFKAQAATTLAVLNATGATSIRVRVITNASATVFDETITMGRTPSQSSWWQWFFGTRKVTTQAIFNGLPPYTNADILVDIEGGASLAVGVILSGQEQSFSMGVQLGASVGIQDYSRKERNAFGDIVLVERAFARRANFRMMLEAAEVDSFYEFLSSVRATPCLWIGSERFESTTVYGFYRNFDIVIPYPEYAECNLELEGLT